MNDLPAELLEPVLVEAAVSLQLEGGAYRATLGRVCKRWAAMIDRPSFASEVTRRVRDTGLPFICAYYFNCVGCLLFTCAPIGT